MFVIVTSIAMLMTPSLVCLTLLLCANKIVGCMSYHKVYIVKLSILFQFRRVLLESTVVFVIVTSIAMLLTPITGLFNIAVMCEQK